MSFIEWLIGLTRFPKHKPTRRPRMMCQECGKWFAETKSGKPFKHNCKPNETKGESE